MPHFNCFLSNCGRRIPSNKPKYGLKMPQLWPLYQNFVGSSWEESDMDKFICDKCHIKIRSQLKDSDSKNFKRRTEPEVDSTLIMEERTRSKRSRAEVDTSQPRPPSSPQPSTSRQKVTMQPHPSTSSRPEDQTDLDLDLENDIESPRLDEEDPTPDPNALVESVSEIEMNPEVIPFVTQDSQLSAISVSSSFSIKARRLPGINSVSSSQKSCFVCHRPDERKRIPKEALSQVWLDKRIMVPHDNRCCGFHLNGKLFTDEAMELIIATKDGVLMTDAELSSWILELTGICRNGKSGQRRYNFDDATNVKTDDYPLLVGLSKSEFDMLLPELSGYVNKSSNRSVRNALGIFLMLLRHNLSQNVLSSLFGFQNQSCMSDTINSVAVALDKVFTKKNLGFGPEHLSRESALADHSRRMYNRLFEEEDPSKLFLVMDGTYVFIEKPTDVKIQQDTYSGQKKRNLVKPFMLVLPSGYILDAAGPYYANGANNDAGILKDILKALPADSPWLKPGDHHILDRGFRDVIHQLNDLKIATHMPSLMNPKEKQFTTKQGNESRKVTLVRWLVEAVNGRIKKKFRFFRDTVPGGYLEKIGMFFRIACAIINKFCPPLSSNSIRHDRIAEKALLLVDQVNALQIRVDEKKLDRNTKSWKKAGDEDCQDFPHLSLDDLEGITLGVYQTGLAKRYSKRHMEESDDFEIKLNTEFENIVRAKIGSRFSKRKYHNLWISYAPDVDGADGVVGYYCRCKQGARTLGCCAHVCTVLWYLGYWRHQVPNILKVRRRSLKDLGIKDAGAVVEEESEDDDAVDSVEESDDSDA